MESDRTLSAKTFALKGADPQDASIRVLIVPHAGAGAASGQGFAEHAPADWLVATARLPGRETRIRESVPDLPGLVDDVVATARALPGTAPLLVVGVCFGAIVGLEAVRALQRDDGVRVAGMVAVSQWAVTEKPDPERRLLRDTDDTDGVLAILDGFGGVPERLAANEQMLEAGAADDRGGHPCRRGLLVGPRPPSPVSRSSPCSGTRTRCAPRNGPPTGPCSARTPAVSGCRAATCC
jgi:hypothetical protein